ncbi:MAG: hypothetical protein L0229_24370 [Blastocatellia bacterium]|nr:hypothetical protein [Blastocatellia bacterium]
MPRYIMMKSIATAVSLVLLTVNIAQAQALEAKVASNSGGTPELARAAFERFKKLEGSWKGSSTKGWERTVTFNTIARGSAVVQNSFDAQPSEMITTAFYMDGDRLMLTHYCVTKNQPRLVATSFEDSGKTISFTFLDGTNLSSRDQGHMDRLIFRFLDENRVTSQWTWYQNGKESWMEEIQLERTR